MFILWSTEPTTIRLIEGRADPLRAPKAAPRPRIQTLSDLIFGLALSIGAIILISSKPGTLEGLIGSLSLFGFSFLILSLVWFRYTSLTSVLPIETERLVAANMMLLFLVSIEPYLFNLITFGPNPGEFQAIVTAAYAVDVGSMNLILAYFTHELTVEEKGLLPGRLLRRYRLQRATTLVVALLFFVSILPIFWTVTIFGTPIRIILWILTFPLGFLRRLLDRSRGPSHVESEGAVAAPSV
jgi:uncharacterized membrane protein